LHDRLQAVLAAADTMAAVQQCDTFNVMLIASKYGQVSLALLLMEAPHVPHL
jgi:hypothetical protein